MHPAIPQARPVDPAVAAAVARHGRTPEALLPVLRSLNETLGVLSREIIRDVARAMNLPPERVEGAATFYAMLTTPRTSRLAQTAHRRRVIRFCDGLTCWLNGAEECRRFLENELSDQAEWTVVRSSCLGLCDRAPAAFVEGRQCGPLTIPNPRLSVGIRAHADGLSFDHPHPATSYAEPLQGEHRVVLRRAGKIDPRSLDEALAEGAYQGLQNALQQPPEAVITEIDKSGLRGRGGAGFPTGRKWRLVAEAPPAERYVICNADESEPLTFKDRVLLESDPHAVLEGMAICGYAVGALQGIIYIRGEYEPQAQLLEHAIQQAEERNLLGEEIAGSDCSFHVHVHRGAGAYICGEETALLESLAGRRGEPRIRPPYPAAEGLRGMPTVVNNVETLATAAVILNLGADEYRRLGNPACPGTRLHTIQGHVNRTGIVELPFGFTLREIIDRFGGGMRPGIRAGAPVRAGAPATASNFHFALTGGAAGTFVTEKQLDVPLDHSAAASGVAVGSGGILVCDGSVSPVAVLREAMWFFENESCGKCTPCRIGTGEARRTLDELLNTRGTKADIERLRQLAQTLKSASFCGLGTSAADPIRTALQNFPAEFEMLVSG